MIEVKQSTFIRPSEACKSCYARSLLSFMAFEYLMQNVNAIEEAKFTDPCPVTWARVDAIMDAYYSLGIIPDNLYVSFQAKVEALFNYQITPEAFAEYVKSLKISDLIS